MTDSENGLKMVYFPSKGEASQFVHHHKFEESVNIRNPHVYGVSKLWPIIVCTQKYKFIYSRYIKPWAASCTQVHLTVLISNMGNTNSHLGSLIPRHSKKGI